MAPTRATIDAWSKLGAAGWTWEQLRPYYKKAYSLQLPDEATQKHIGTTGWLDRDSHGSSGPIKVSFSAGIESPVLKEWLGTFQSIGYGITADPFSGQSSGGYSTLAAIDSETKTRSYAATGYGLPAMQRSNVRIITETLVRRIEFDSDSIGDRSPEKSSQPSIALATGVQILLQNQIHSVRANREVIISAGAINTPKLLELSGIGNRKILDQLHIPLVVDNPNVGENLQDHLMSGISFESVDSVPTADGLMRQEPEALQSAMHLYTEHKTGPLTSPGMQSGAFMPFRTDSGGEAYQKEDSTSMQEYLDKWPITADQREKEIRHILSQPGAPTSSQLNFLAQVNLHETGKTFVGQNLLPGNFISLGLLQTLPFSRGTVHVSSVDPAKPPVIDPRYFSHPLDLDIMARGLLDIHQIHRVKPISELLKPNGRRNHPDAFLTDLESAKKYLQATATSSYHPCGTAAMLPLSRGGVLDENLQVYGTKNLRVCDASIFPLIPAANIMSTVYAVAERAADLIKAGSEGQ
jgi:choline dehydrogenase-like flavoprotein